MSEPTDIESVNRAYEAWNSGDRDSFVQQVHPDVVWEPSGAFPGIGTRYEGREGVLEFLDAFWGPWSKVSIEFTEVRQLAPGHVLVRVRFKAEGREGIQVEQDFGQRYEIRDGLLFRMKSYPTWDAALAANGLG